MTSSGAALGCAAVVWARPTLSLGALRVLELVFFAVIVAFCAKFRYTALTHGLEGAWEGPAHRTLFLLQISMVNNMFWNFTIVCYGVFIPNTWRRCTAVVAVTALIPLTITVAAGLQDEVVRERLFFLLGWTSLALLISSALAVFGCFKISTLQREAVAARQLGQVPLGRDHHRLGSDHLEDARAPRAQLALDGRDGASQVRPSRPLPWRCASAITTVPCGAPLPASSRAVMLVESSSGKTWRVRPSAVVVRCAVIAVVVRAVLIEKITTKTPRHQADR